MSLVTAINDAVKSAMSAVKDFQSTADIYMVNGEPVFDDATGVYAIPTVSDKGIEVLLYDFEADESISDVNFQTDQMLLVESRFLVNVTKPEYLIIDLVRWDIIKPVRVPGDSIRVFHVRDTGKPS